MNSGHSPQEIANRMREARKAKNLSQEELGRRLGLTKVAYGDYERVKRLLDTEQLFQLERFLNCSVAWLLGLPLKEGELSALEQILRRLGHNTGVHITPHALRRTCALWCHRSGWRLTEIQRLLGHSDLTVLLRYLDLDDSDVGNVFGKAPPTALLS